MNRRHLFGAKNRRSYLLRRLRCSFEQLSERRLLAVDDGMLFQAIDPQWFQAGEHINRLRSMPQRNSSNLEEGTSDHSGSVYGPVELTYGEWIVQLSTTALATIQTPADAPRLLAAPGIEFQLIQGLGKPGLVLLQSKASSTEEVAQLLRLNALVEYATPNGLVDSARLPDDTRFSSMTNLLNVGQLGTAVDADVDAELAWDFTVGSPQVVVGIVDSGIDVTHPDLYLNVWINQGEIPTGKRNLLQDSDADGLFTFYDLNQASNQSLVRDLNGNTYIDALDLLSDPQWSDGLDTDGNGFIDDFFGWNFRAGANEPFAANNPMDNFGHGTHVAGTVGAVGNNAIGVTGINWRTSLMSLKFLDENNQGDTAAAIAAINYATMMRSEFDVNVRVLNNSWGQPSGANAALAAAIEESGDAGILFVAAAGNGNILGNGIDNDRSPFYPASYSLSNVISVAASDGQDRLAAFSNFGASSVDLVAPGVGVLSTLPGKRYGTANGTSMSTPHVTGSAALIWSRLPNALVSEVRAALLTGVDPIAELTGKVASGGRLNLAKSLQANVFSVQARVTSASNIVTAGGVDNQVEVEYFHPDGIDLATIDSGDLIVTRDWGADHKVLSQLINGSIVSSADDRTVKARYRALAPGGTWDTLDFGTYRISLSVGAVNSKQGRTSNTAAFGSFLVRINDPSVFYVNTTVDSVDQTIGNGQAIDTNGRTSLRAAIQEANASGSAKTLILDDGRYLLSQAGRGEDLAVTGDLDVRVPISIYANQRSTTEIDANFLDRAFDVQATGQLTLARVAIKKGQPLATENGGVVRAIGNVLLDDVLISDGKAIQGGGVFVAGNATATVRSSSINSNTANDAGGAIAVLGCGQLTLDRSTIAFNIATTPTSRGGAGILIDNQVCSVQPQNTVVNSTISTNGNDRFSVGGLYMNSGRLIVDHSTIAKNIGTGIEFFDTSFGATNGTGVLSFSIANSIVIENRGIGLRNDFYLPMGFASTGYNVLGVGSGGVAGNDILSLFAQPLTNIIDSLSEDAQGNLIHPLLPNSRAIDAADPLSPVTIDQLGNARGADGNGRFIANQPYEPDIGAVEAVAARIEGIVFADVDGDGVRDPSESGLVGRVVFLDDNNSGLLDSTEISTRTVADDPTTLTVNEAGSYEFSGVVPGRRVVRIAQVDGWQHRLSGSDELVSRTATGQEPSGSADLPQVSQQGRLILFESDATDLVSGPENDQFIFDSYLKTVQALPMPAGIVGSPRTVISDSGNIIVFQTDISLTVLDRATGIFGSFEESTGIQPNAPFVLGDVSADGRYVVFSSAATNLVGTDPRLTVDVNGFADVFWWDRQNGIVRNLSLANDGLQANAESIGPIISSDGMRVAFLSSATNLSANDNNQAADYFLYDLSSDQILRISPAVPGNGIGDSFEGAINGNGDYVIFRAFVGQDSIRMYTFTAELRIPSGKLRRSRH